MPIQRSRMIRPVCADDMKIDCIAAKLVAVAPGAGLKPTRAAEGVFKFR